MEKIQRKVKIEIQKPVQKIKKNQSIRDVLKRQKIDIQSNTNLCFFKVIPPGFEPGTY